MGADEFLNAIPCHTCGARGVIYMLRAAGAIMARHQMKARLAYCDSCGAYDLTPVLAEHVESLMIKAQKALSRSKK